MGNTGQISKKNRIIPKETRNKKDYNSRRGKIIYSVTLAVLAVFLISMTAGIVIHNGYSISKVNPAESSGYATSGVWKENYYDIFGQLVWTTYFAANWTFFATNGSLIYGYAPYWAAKVVSWDTIGSVVLKTPKWANTAPNTYVAYGDGTYYAGVYEFSTAKTFYSEWEVPPGSWGSGQFSAGYGWVSY